MYLIQCYPLNDLLAAVGVTHVDYFSLDVQGAELAILKTIDFNVAIIDIIVLEVFDNNRAVKTRMAKEMRDFFNQTGVYRESHAYGNDIMFERIDLKI